MRIAISTNPRDRLLLAARQVYGRNLFAPRHELLRVARVGKANLSRNFQSLEELREYAFTQTRSDNRKYSPEGKLDLMHFMPDSLRGMKLHKVCKATHVLLWQQYQGGAVFGIKLKRFVKTHLFVAAVSLYAGEGTKSHLGGGVELVNADAAIIRVFLKFLGALGIRSERLTLRVQADSDQLIAAKHMWIENLNVRTQQFRSPIVKRGGIRRGRPSLVVKYHNTVLQLLLNYWASQLEKLVCVSDKG